MLLTTDGEASRTLEAVFREHFSYVSYSLLRLGVPQRDVDDLVHDVFIAVHRRLRDFDPSRPLRPWLFGIAFRVVSEYRRRPRQRRELMVDAQPDVADEARAPDSEAAAAQTRARVLRALDALDADKRAVLVMHDIDSHSASEIAEALGIPTNTVYSRLRVARERLRDELSESTVPEEVRR